MIEKLRPKLFGHSPATYGIASVISAVLAWAGLWLILHQGPDFDRNHRLFVTVGVLLPLLGLACGLLSVGAGIYHKHWLAIVAGAIGLGIIRFETRCLSFIYREAHVGESTHSTDTNNQSRLLTIPQPVIPVAPSVNDAQQTSAAPREADVSAAPDSIARDTAESASEDHERIQGKWDYVTLTTGPRDSIVFSQDKITFHVREKTVAGTFILDANTQPKRIDLLFAGKPDGPDSRQGIYQFQSGLLVICLGTLAGSRPTEFQKGETQNYILLVRPTADSKQGIVP